MHVVGLRSCQREGWTRDLSRETREEIGHPRINSLSLSSQLLASKRYFVHESAREFLTVVKRKTNTRETTYSRATPLGIPEGIEVKFARRHSTANV